MFEIEAFRQLLFEKGIITEDELIAKYKKVDRKMKERRVDSPPCKHYAHGLAEVCSDMKDQSGQGSRLSMERGSHLPTISHQTTIAGFTCLLSWENSQYWNLPYRPAPRQCGGMASG